MTCADPPPPLPPPPPPPRSRARVQVIYSGKIGDRRSAIGDRRGHGAELERITLEIYRRGAALAAERGVLIADTKPEFGRAANGSFHAGRRGADPGFVAVLGRRFVGAGLAGAFSGQVISATGRGHSTGIGSRPGRQFPRRSCRSPAGNVNTAPVSYSATTPSTSPALARLRKSCPGSAGFAGFSGSHAKS